MGTEENQITLQHHSNTADVAGSESKGGVHSQTAGGGVYRTFRAGTTIRILCKAGLLTTCRAFLLIIRTIYCNLEQITGQIEHVKHATLDCGIDFKTINAQIRTQLLVYYISNLSKNCHIPCAA